MASTAPVSGGWTYQRYLELDDETRYEILDGELLMTPAPGTQHQRVIRDLFLQFALFVRERRLGELFVAPYDVVLDKDQVVQPDILFIRAGRVEEIVRERAVHGAPDLVVEILSPGSVLRDRNRKRALYERAGVPEYWIVDPANRAIEVLSLGEGGYRLIASAEGEGSVGSRVLEGLVVAVEEVVPA